MSKQSAKPAIRRKLTVTAVLIALLVLLIAAAAAMPLLRAFVVEAYKIPAASMAPTLLIGDHVFVTKSSYRPRRGDVVVFAYPPDERKDFVKRIVALGGDTIEVRDHHIVLDGKPIPRRRLAQDCKLEDEDEARHAITRPCVAYEEQLGGMRYHVVQDPQGGSGSFARSRVPAGHVFVLGDNRDNSHDSRHWGTVPVANIKGRVSVIWWSSGPQGMRDGRFWKDVHAQP